MDQNPYEAPRAGLEKRSSRWRRPTIVEVLVLVGVVVVLLSLFLPAVRSSPRPRHRMQRIENIPAENRAESRPDGVTNSIAKDDE